MPRFIGGPRDGEVEFDPSMDMLPPGMDQGLSSTDLPAETPAESEPAELDEGGRFDRMLSDALALASGDMSEQNKLAIQKVMTELQKIKAAEEKESEGMMQGKLSPGLMRRAYGG